MFFSKSRQLVALIARILQLSVGKATEAALEHIALKLLGMKRAIFARCEDGGELFVLADVGGDENSRLFGPVKGLYQIIDESALVIPVATLQRQQGGEETSGEMPTTNEEGRVILFFSEVSKRGIEPEKAREAVETFAEIVNISRRINEYRRQGDEDELTKLGSRRLWERSLEDAAKTLLVGEQLSQNVLVIMLDIDGLKGINDQKGHDAGDALIQEAASSIHDVFNEDAFIKTRLHGDEFGIISQNWKSVIIEQRLKEIVIACQRGYDGVGTVSVGAILVQTGKTHDLLEHATNAEVITDQEKRQLLFDLEQVEPGSRRMCRRIAVILKKMADKALYDSKRNGRNRYTFFVTP